MKLGELEDSTNVYVFPHMGDGGLALGAAMGVNYEKFGVAKYHLKNLYLGPQFTRQEILGSLKQWGRS